MEKVLIFSHTMWSRQANRMTVLLLGLAKLSINRPRQWAVKGVVAHDCLTDFCGYICAQASLEMVYAVSRQREGNCHPYLAWPTCDSRPTAMWLTLNCPLGN
eukprot:g32872.t1